ncbi:MAG: hypothetical protein JWN03_1842 [Nocardia sp.]|uniref:hypothetical protein n=1 Tax=Nocardia sp. TaxID=1821 RepID=UPI00260F4992|nr:hypothetical protein [Nocardia sp.]MCU1641567.1 hypothetical protein [Nocardia sp.]
MTNPTPPPAGPETSWGTPQSAPTSAWTAKKTVTAVGIAAVLAAAGGGIVYASSSANTNSAHEPGGPGGTEMTAGPGGGTVTGPPLHGEFVVSDGNGGYTTELTQTGTVTALSAISITAESSDKYAQTYTIAATIKGASALHAGDTVSIHATKTDGTATITAISEGIGTGLDGGGGGPGGKSARPGGTGGDPGGMGNDPMDRTGN